MASDWETARLRLVSNQPVTVAADHDPIRELEGDEGCGETREKNGDRKPDNARAEAPATPMTRKSNVITVEMPARLQPLDCDMGAPCRVSPGLTPRRPLDSKRTNQLV